MSNKNVKSRGHQKRWTQEEKDFLYEELMQARDVKDKPLPNAMIVHFYNQRFPEAVRTPKAIETMKHQLRMEHEAPEFVELKEEVEAVVEEPKKDKNMKKIKRKRDDSVPNSGMGWNPADDEYLLCHWKASMNDRLRCCEHLGRTYAAAANRIGKIKKDKDYMSRLMAGNITVRPDDSWATFGKPGFFERLGKKMETRRIKKQIKKKAKLQKELEELGGNT